ncbi:S-4TM family putative pore-forming effector [Kitasatospora sp. NPDC001664]
MAINVRQNETKSIDLLKASSVAYRRIKMLEGARYLASSLLALAGIGVSFAKITVPAISIAGAVWAAISALLIAPLLRTKAAEAAEIQEKFDCYVYQIKPSANPGILPPERVHELASRYKGNDQRLRDWYPDVASAKRPFDILICQRSNAAWDIRLRERWAVAIRVFVAAWMIFGFIVGMAMDMTTSQLAARWYAPSAGLILLGFELIHSQQQIILGRSELRARLTAELEWMSSAITSSRTKSLERSCRSIQDGILATRSQAGSVPDWFYRRFRPGDQAAMDSAAGEIVSGG